MDKRNKGITLISLVITIIVLLILAGVSIVILTKPNGIFTRTNDAKVETALGAVKEALKLEQGEKVIDNKNLTPEILLSEGKVSRTVQPVENDTYYMYYAIKENAYEGMQGLGKGNISTLKDVFLIDDNLNVKYIASNGKEYGDNLDNKVLDDETNIRFSSKAFSEYVSKISGVTEDEMKFKWMKNQTKLTISDSNVDSLQDLVFFPNLITLIIGEVGVGSPEITTLDGIENCIKLTTISIIGGQDKEYMRLVDLPNLKSFTRSYGKNDYDNIIDALKLCVNIENVAITNSNSIDNMHRIGELKDLKSLAMYSNKVSRIEGLENKISLVTLNLLGNEITKIEGLENLKNLQVLNLTKNKIVDITPLEKNIGLIRLDLKQNTGINGDRSNYTGKSLEALDKIGEILDRNGRINIDIDKIGLFKNYRNLDLSGQKINTLKLLKGLTKLESLVLSNNQLTLEDLESQEILKSMTNLVNLNLNENNIIDIKVINNLKNLKNLCLKGNQIDLKDIQDIISNLDSLEVSTENLQTIINCDDNKINKLSLGYYSYITELPNLLKFSELIELNLYNNHGITNFDLVSELASLKILNLKSCNLHGRMINFTQLKKLTNLNLSNNTLWDEDLENLKALNENTNLTIDLSNNSIINATALLEMNPNTKIDLRGNVNLTQDAKTKLQEHFKDKVTF